MRKFEELSWEERKIIIDKTKEDFIKTIDLEPLYEEIRNMINVKDVRFESKIVEGRYEKYIEIKSEELIDKVGIMIVALKSVRLETFNTSIEFDKETQTAYWWGSIDFRYENAGGGSNGIEVLIFRFEDGKYTFRRTK